MPATLIEPHRRKVLIADDHSDTLELSRMILESGGHEVLLAEDGMQAAELAERSVPDVIFADLVLPELDGFELCRRLRSQHRFDRSVLLAVSGLGDTESIEQAVNAGFDYYALKPVDADVYLNCVHAPRQEMLILLSASLVEYSEQLRERSAALSERSRRAREQSEAIIRTWFPNKYF
jgi:CheY-like chemotaxis protein